MVEFLGQSFPAGLGENQESGVTKMQFFLNSTESKQEIVT